MTEADGATTHKTKEDEGTDMAGNTVWFVTGAGRGLGVDIAQAALAAGHSVVATGRNGTRSNVTSALSAAC